MRIKLVVSFVSIVVMLVCFTASIAANDLSSQLDVSREEFAAFQVDPVFLENREIAETHINMLYSTFMSARDGSVLYPDYFAGIYIDPAGNLVTVIVDEYLSNVDALRSSSTLSFIMGSNVKVESAEHSLNELFAIHSDVSLFAKLNPTDRMAVNIQAVGISISGNGVVVYLSDLCDEYIAAFKDYISDSSAIIFERSPIQFPFPQYTFGSPPSSYYVGTEFCMETGLPLSAINALADRGDIPVVPLSNITLRPGQRIYFRSPWSGHVDPRFSSIGFRARRFGTPGFVTSTHGYVFHVRVGDFALVRDPSLNPWYPHFIHVGVVEDVAHWTTGRSPANDSTFVRLLDNTIYVTRSLGNSLHTASPAQVIQHDMIFGLGGNSGAFNGFITDTHLTIPIMNNIVVVMTSAISAGGDSGGIVTSVRPSNPLIGIVRGAFGPTPTDTRGPMFFSRATDAFWTHWLTEWW